MVSIQEEQRESIKVQTSSTKLLNFLVNDMLDLSQMNSGKFRKNDTNFDLKEAMDEIINILMLKAEFSGVELSLDMKNFPESNFKVCSDHDRI